ncbi:MAG: methionine--tRNA ligase, partial [Candidatus Delongbacteria bacterium]
DIFYRTTDKKHVAKVQRILQNLFDKGDIYKDLYVGNYCTPCETFFTDKDLVEGKCPFCSREIEKVSEENYFFNMGKYSAELEEYINNNPDFIKPNYRKNEVLGIIKKGLRPLCISRKKEKMSWGIELPFDSNFVTYVWFDALTNYINGIGYLEEGSEFEELWKNSINFVGKDILLHHTIYWPTMLLAMGLTPPQHILIHGWWLSDGEKMSKSLGNAIDPLEIIEKYGASSFRFYLLREMSIGNDGNFTMPSFVERHNNELLNDFGNLVNRGTHFISKNFDSKIPNPTLKTEFCDDLEKLFNSKIETIEKYLYKFELNKLLDEIMLLVRSTNKYLENTAPWKLIKDNKELCGSVLYRTIEAIRIVSLYLEPVIPETIKKLDLTFETKPRSLEFGKFNPGESINKGENLFTKLEYIKEEKKVDESNLITIDDFNKIEIKTGEILESSFAEGSDKLLLLKISVGKNDIRQIVSGIAKYYKEPEVLIGKKVLVATNLKPAVIRGIESNGMLLSIKQGKKLKVVEIDNDLPLGKKLQ